MSNDRRPTDTHDGPGQDVELRKPSRIELSPTDPAVTTAARIR